MPSRFSIGNVEASRHGPHVLFLVHFRQMATGPDERMFTGKSGNNRPMEGDADGQKPH
jgi:hypothetical protein